MENLYYVFWFWQIPKNLFRGLSRLTALDLSDNNLLLFPMDAIRPIALLQHLSLDFNRISAIQSIPTANLKTLSIGNNLIRHIPAEAFKYLNQLEQLHLHVRFILYFNVSGVFILDFCKI